MIDISQQINKARKEWLTNRSKLEAIRFNKLSERSKKTGRITLLDHLAPYLTLSLKMAGVYRWGHDNALSIVLKEHELFFEQLPKAFDGYRILHLTDLHIDCLPGLENVICDIVEDLRYDICVMTGDYRLGAYGEYTENVTEPLRKITSIIQAPDGIFATLGNHDTQSVVKILESMGVQMLTNETVPVFRGLDKILFTGTDDPYIYFSNQITESLKTPHHEFKIALVHTPELYKEAAANGYHLYLSGHTHAGQICLPNGIPIISHLNKGKHLVAGLWKEGNMTGYTSAGCGTSGLPVRFNCKGEVTLFTLRRG